MEKVTVYRPNVTDILAVVHELRATGLCQGTDFDWTYYPSSISPDNSAKHAVFSFTEGGMAAWFALKWT